MSSSVRLGLQFCSEPCRTEPRSSRLIPDPQKSQFSNSILEKFRALAMEINTDNEEEELMSSGKDCNEKTQKKSEMGEWSFLQSLSSSSRIIKTENKEDKLYVHPLSKSSSSSSSSTLNLKSLEMCTESLGSENGSEESESSSKEENHRVWSTETQKSPRKQSLKSKRVKNRAGFPPPIRSHDGVRIKSHRENGRLVLKAEFGHCCKSYFQAERGNGRLRLRLMTKNWSAYRKIEGDEEEKEGIEENSEVVGAEMEIEKFPLPGRCKECGTGGRNRLNRAGPFWVATTIGSV